MAVSIIIAVLIQLYMNKNVAKPIKKISTMMDHISKGDLTVEKISENIASSSEELTATSQQSASASEEIAKTIMEIAKGASEQAQDTEKAAKDTLNIGKVLAEKVQQFRY